MSNMKSYFLLMTWFLVTMLILPCLTLYATTVSGRVIDHSLAVPIENIRVNLLSDTHSWETVTDAKGSYEFLNISSGQYKIQAEPPEGYMAVSTNPLTIDVDTHDVKANFSLAPPGNIMGSVKDGKTNLPIANAQINVMRGNYVVMTAFTDESGNYFLSGLAPRPYLLKVKMPYFQSGLQLGVPISNQTITVDFVLKCPPSKVEGKVINNVTGQPIANATVDILDQGSVIDSIQSNEEGQFYLSEIVPNSYQIRVTAPQFESYLEEILILTHQTLAMDVALTPHGNVYGQVVHAFTRQPIIGASVEVWQNDHLFAVVHTDENGYFKFFGMGQYELVFQAPQFQSYREEVLLLTNQTLAMDVALTPYGNVYGQVVHAFTRQPIIGASVEVWQNDHLFAAVHTDENGYFKFFGMGQYELLFQAPQFHDFQQTVQLLSPQETSMSVSLICLEPTPPIKISVKRFYKCVAHQVHRVHCIKWKASKDPSVVAYRLYRENKLIAEKAAKDSFIFYDKWRSERKSTYAVTAVNAFGQESAARSVTIK